MHPRPFFFGHLPTASPQKPSAIPVSKHKTTSASFGNEGLGGAAAAVGFGGVARLGWGGEERGLTEGVFVSSGASSTRYLGKQAADSKTTTSVYVCLAKGLQGS